MKSMCHDVRRNSPSVAVRTPGVALERHDVADRGVLDLAQAVVVELAGPVPGAGVEEVGRPEQAPDVVGAERRKRSGGHVSERTPADQPAAVPPSEMRVADAEADRPEPVLASWPWLTYSSSTTSRA